MNENSRSDVQHMNSLAANADILAGWIFCATMQRRTPLRILLHHNEFHPNILTEPPQYARTLWEGTWVAKTNSWQELGGEDFLEFEDVGMASEIGTIPINGGEYLQFLLAVRRIVESDESITVRLSWLQEEMMKERWSTFASREGHSFSDLSLYFFPDFLDRAPKLREATRAGLRELGIRSADEVLASSYEQLCNISGIGKRTYEALREFARTVKGSCEEHRIDCVNK